MDTCGTGTVCPPYREPTKRSKERQGPTLGGHFTEVYVLSRCPLRESQLYFQIKVYYVAPFTGVLGFFEYFWTK